MKKVLGIAFVAALLIGGISGVVKYKRVAYDPGAGGLSSKVAYDPGAGGNVVVAYDPGAGGN